MAISLASLKRAGDTRRPPTLLGYSVHGLGKSSLAAGAPDPVFIQTEDGLVNKRLAEIPTFGLLKTYGEIMEAIGSLYVEDHDRKTVVLDTLDHTEPLVWQEAVARMGWRDIEHDAEGKTGFGKGYLGADSVWRELLDGFAALRDEKGMTVVFLAHSEVKRVEPPDTEPYDRYLIKLHKRAAALVQERVDAVLFMNYRVSIIKDAKAGQKKDQGHARGVGGGSRVVYTEERPAFLAKNRFDMPDSIQLPDMQPTDDIGIIWQSVANHIPYFGAAA